MRCARQNLNRSTNNYLTREEFDRFCRLPGRAVVKHRWILEDTTGRYGVDAYLDALAGLIIAEREFQTHEGLLAAPAPAFDGIDVTGHIEFTGGALAGRSFDELRPLVCSLLAT